ncbi:MAG: GAF domain-containing protein [Chloroflexi bacterium]|nr:GAF domain-containing protein [Chloroflexota bacterium]
MRTFIQRLFDVSSYKTGIERSRARIAQVFTWIGLVAFSLYALRVSPDTQLNLFQEMGTSLLWALVIPAFYGSSLATLIAVQRGYLRFATFGPVVAFFLLGVVQAITAGFTSARDGMMIVAFVLIAGLLNETRGIVVSLVAALISVTVGIALRPTLPDPPPANLAFINWLLYSFILISVSLLVYAFIGVSKLARAEGATSATQERLKLADITTQLSQRISRREALLVVLEDVVEQIIQAYPAIYHAQVFLIDESGQEAKLEASTGEAGRQLLARAHALAVGSLSVIGQVTVRKQPIIARADDEQNVHRRNELLPETAVEAAFPLMIGDTVIGALDLQSKNAATFALEETVSLFRSLADSIAIAIDNARLFEQAEARVRENQRLVEQTRAALREVEQLNERLTGRAWSDYLRDFAEELALKVDFDSDDTQPTRLGREHERGWTPTLAEAARLNYLVQDSENGRRVVAMPLRVRGQVIGAMEFELDDDMKFSSEELTLLQDVSERFGLAAENTRLLEESQRLAQREALVNEISTRLQASNNVETTLAEAARSLKDSLKATRVSIRLGTIDTQAKGS